MLTLHDSALHTSSLSFFRAPFAANWDSPADLPLLRCGIAVFTKEACHVRCTCYSQKRMLRQLNHSARETSVEGGNMGVAKARVESLCHEVGGQAEDAVH